MNQTRQASVRARMRTVLPPATAAIAVALLATACTTGGATGGASKEAGGTVSTDTINTVLNADPTSFAPHEVKNADDYMASRLLFDTLVRRDENNTIVPGLATGWEITPTKGVFTIREGATCSDGSPVTPQTVADSLTVFATDAGSSFRPLVFGKGEATISADQAAGTVTIDLAQPWTDLLQGMSLHASGIVCEPGLQDLDGLAAGEVEGAFTGPYTLTKKQHGVAYEFSLREDYKTWPEFETPIEGTPAKFIKASVNANSSAVSNELLTGTKDIALVRGKDATRFANNKDFSTTTIPQGSLYVMFNEREGHPFTDARLRKAVAQSLNQKAFNQAATGGLGEPYASFAHPGVPCSNKDASLLVAEDVAAAKQALAGLKVKMVGAQVFGPNGAGNTYVAEALRAAGADVELRNVDLATWSTDLTQKPESWDITVMGGVNAGGTMYGALSTMVGTPVEEGGLNWGGFENKPVLDLVAQAMTQADDAERCATYQQAQQVMIGEAHAIPLSSLPVQDTVRSGFSSHTMNGQSDASTMRITR